MAAEPKPAAVQVFGYRDSRPTQQALRFFRERGIRVNFVDLERRPIARAELQRFAQKFGARALLDASGRAFRDAGLAYIRLEEAEAFERLLADQRLIRVPLVRSGNALAHGVDDAAWRELVARD